MVAYMSAHEWKQEHDIEGDLDIDLSHAISSLRYVPTIFPLLFGIGILFKTDHIPKVDLSELVYHNGIYENKTIKSVIHVFSKISKNDVKFHKLRPYNIREE